MKKAQCTKCNEYKDLDNNNFQFRSDAGRFRTICRECVAKRKREWRSEKNKDIVYVAAEKEKTAKRNRQYYADNTEDEKNRAKEYRKNNTQRIRANNKAYYDSNKDIILRKRKLFRQNNLEYVRRRDRKYCRGSKERSRTYRKRYPNKVRTAYKKWLKNNPDYHKDYVKNKRANDVGFRMACNLRTRLRDALKNNSKTGSAVKLLGCSIDYLKQHLEAQFEKGMSWDNYGQWHIDHIKPLSLFDLTDVQQLKEACCYTNLQPLWAIDNIKKGNTYEDNTGKAE